jgi:cytochrome P450
MTPGGDDTAVNDLPAYTSLAHEFEPFDGYAKLRERCPLYAEHDHEPPFYVLSRYADVLEVLKQPELWGNRDGPGVFYQQAGALGSADDPDHARHRRALRSAFLPRATAHLEPRIAAIADELFDEFVPLGEGDFVDLFAFPFPAVVIAELLGVRAEQRDAFRHWSAATMEALTGGDLDAYETAKNAIADFVEAEVELRERRLADAEAIVPEDVSTLLAIGRRDGALTGEEVRHLGYQLLVAGHETTTNLLSMMLYRLIERPDLMARLRAEPELVPNAVEEALRFDSPVQGLFRTNAVECTLGGQTLPPRTKLQLLFASANRDPQQWEAADEFRLDRDRNVLHRHLAFGWGIHLCIGAPLARLEGRLTLERLLGRMDDIELTGEPRRNDSFVMRGLTSLPLRWTPRG